VAGTGAEVALVVANMLGSAVQARAELSPTSVSNGWLERFGRVTLAGVTLGGPVGGCFGGEQLDQDRLSDLFEISIETVHA